MGSIIKQHYLKFVLIGILLYTATFTGLCALRYQALFSDEWEDEATENQLLWNTVHGKFLKQTLFPNTGGILIDHVNPIYILISLFYSIFPSIYTLYFLISSAFALTAIPLYLLAKKVWQNELQATLLAFAYLFFSPLHWINVTTVEPLMFSVPFLASAFYFYHKGVFRYFSLFLFLAVMTKENISLISIMFGLYALGTRRGFRWAAFPFLLGLIWFLASVWVIYPMIGSPDKTPFYCLPSGSFQGLISAMAHRLRELFEYMFTKERFVFLSDVFKPVLFLPFLSWEWLMALPTFLEILLVDDIPGSNWSYSLSPAIPFMFVSLIFALRNIKKIFVYVPAFRSKTVMMILNGLIYSIMLSSAYSNFGNNRLGFLNNDQIDDRRFIAIKNIYDHRFYETDQVDKEAWNLIKMIPEDACVSASGDLLVPLSHRACLREFARDEFGSQNYDYYNTDYIFINRKSFYHGTGHYAKINDQHLNEIKKLISDNVFTVIAEKDTFLLLKKNFSAKRDRGREKT